MRDAKPLVGKLLALLLVQHHAVSKPAVFVVPLDLPAAGEMQMGSGEISGRGGGWEGGGTRTAARQDAVTVPCRVLPTVQRQLQAL